MENKKKIILFILIGLFANTSFSQTENTDFSAWFSAQLNYKLNKKWTFSLQEQLRLKENASTIDGYFTQLGVRYNLVKGLTVGVGYRYIRKNDNKGAKQGYDSYNRYQFDLLYGHKISRFNMKYRTRFNTRNEIGVSKADGDIPRNYIRFKAGTRYNIKGWKLDPELSSEIFYRLGSEVSSDNGFNGYRVTFGTSYTTKKIGKIGVYYRLEKEINTENPRTNNILRIKYSYTIKNKKKKKKKKK